MKKIVFIIAAFLILACDDDKPEKPSRLLSEDEMADILYDVTMLQSIKSFKPNVLNDNDINVNSYIYNKYNIDSTVFAQNHTYYAAQLDVYERIHKKVSQKVKKLKEPYESLIKAKADSIRESKMNLKNKDTIQNQLLKNKD